jgi:diguanylate cyclase (GGDEF)-like protein
MRKLHTSRAVNDVHNSVQRRQSLRTRLVLLALGPLLVSSTLSFQRADAEHDLLAHAETLRTTALASSAVGRLGAYLEFERTMTMGTVQLIEAKIPVSIAVPFLGVDPRDAVAKLVQTVDAAEPIVIARLRANHDPAAEELAGLLVPRRSLVAGAEAGTVKHEDVTKVYDALATFIADERALLQPSLDQLTRTSGADQALADTLATSDSLDQWSSALAIEGRLLSSVTGNAKDTPADAKSRIGAAVIAEAGAIERLQASSYVSGTALVSGSEAIAQWVTARDTLMTTAGMGLGAPPEADSTTRIRLIGEFFITTTNLLDAANPVYARVDADVLEQADALVRDANRTLFLAIAIAALVTMIVILWVLVIARRVTGPLRRLGRRASEVSDGQLTGEPIGPVGPREVASVAVAFDEVCANLRLVELQTEALAEGRLDDVVLTERIPGRLGESLQRSIARVSDLSERLADQARRDPMTELPNRAAVMEHLNRALQQLEHPRDSLAVLFVDLDGFKAINDAHGHGAGDEVLRDMAQRFRGVALGGEMVARVGGDEFVVVADRVEDAPTAVALGRRFIEVAEVPLVVNGTTFHLSASVGVAIACDDSTATGLVGDADQAVYQAKREGKGRVRLFDNSLHAAMLQRSTLERDLRRALTADEFELYLQPVIDSATGRMKGAEALIRWNRPGHGVVLPGEFIEFAEESWLIVEIGRVVLDKACRLLAHWATQGRDLSLAVNVAGRHLAEGNLATDVRDALARHGALADRLELELTESHLVTDLENAAIVLAELRKIGVHVALDDFGTGFSSINYLRQLPIDTMKIDGSYVGELGETQQANSVLASLIHLAGSLDLDVVAEGVETDSQAEHLRSLGCPKLQGYLIGRPMPAAEFDIWVEPLVIR